MEHEPEYGGIGGAGMEVERKAVTIDVARPSPSAFDPNIPKSLTLAREVGLGRISHIQIWVHCYRCSNLRLN